MHYALAAVAVDRRRARFDDRLSVAARHPASIPERAAESDRQRYRLSGDAGILTGRFRRLHGGRHLCRLSLDDRDASQLGNVLSRARFLPALHRAGQQPAPARRGRTPRDRAADGHRRLLHAGIGQCQERLRFAALDRRRDWAYLFAALVLVADQRVERGERDDRLVPRCARVLRRRPHRARRSDDDVAADYRRRDDGRLDRRHVSHAARGRRHA